jgi:hypothetical protein
MRILIYTLGVTAVASIAAASNPPTSHPTSHAAAMQTHGNPHTTTTGKPTTSPSSGKTTTPTTTTTTTPNPIAAKISSHPQLASRLTAMLPKGMTLDQASAGFKNNGQFIAALHVSQDLGIPFKDLRTQMVTDHRSLGQSIQTLKKSSDSTTAVKTAEKEADDDVKSTTTTTGSTTTKKTGK